MEKDDPTLRTLRLATQDLLFSSESDRPLAPFLWPRATVGNDAMDEATLRRVCRIDAATPVATIELTSFFAPMTEPQPWHDDADKAITHRFAVLTALLATLGDVRVYRVGTGPEIDVYVIGTTISGDFAGVKTQLTET